MRQKRPARSGKFAVDTREAASARIIRTVKKAKIQVEAIFCGIVDRGDGLNQ
jgi:hypothetical protein